MILVDRALDKREREGRPVRVGLIGAGYMGRGIAAHLVNGVPGLRLAAVSNRHPDQAERAYARAGAREPARVSSAAALDDAIAGGGSAVTDDPFVVTDAEQIDVVVEATGEIEFGARVVVRALKRGKHVVLMNAELDATLGPILKQHADRAGVVITNTDGDEPGVAMNLVRFARTLGYRPVAAGNIKGMLDHYRTPETQRAFAEKYGQKPKHITSFADGTKLSMETTVLANGAGFGVARRGMTGPSCEHVRELLDLLPLEDALERGIVDYCVGAAPHTGAWVIAHTEHEVKRQYMSYFKMGDGPFYLFYTPYHLPHAQIVTTIARAALFADATIAPLGPPMCEVLTLAKRDLKAGETLDGIGGFLTYGWIDNAGVQRRERLLPMGLAEGCVLGRPVTKDQAIRYDDVRVPEGRLCDALRREQDERYGAAR
jgi:predicted homoserine dehydrogenase-like protein